MNEGQGWQKHVQELAFCEALCGRYAVAVMEYAYANSPTPSSVGHASLLLLGAL